MMAAVMKLIMMVMMVVMIRVVGKNVTIVVAMVVE